MTIHAGSGGGEWRGDSGGDVMVAALVPVVVANSKRLVVLADSCSVAAPAK